MKWPNYIADRLAPTGQCDWLTSTMDWWSVLCLCILDEFWPFCGRHSKKNRNNVFGRCGGSLVALQTILRQWSWVRIRHLSQWQSLRTSSVGADRDNCPWAHKQNLKNNTDLAPWVGAWRLRAPKICFKPWHVKSWRSPQSQVWTTLRSVKLTVHCLKSHFSRLAV